MAQDNALCVVRRRDVSSVVDGAAGITRRWSLEIDSNRREGFFSSHVVERGAVEQFRDDEGLPVLRADIEDDEKVRMVEGARGQGLLLRSGACCFPSATILR